MSGLNNYFHSFRNDRSAPVAVSYSHSLGTSFVLDADKKINELEEKRTLMEWKLKFKESLVKYITNRTFREEDAQQNFNTKEDFYFAAKFGFIPASIAEAAFTQEDHKNQRPSYSMDSSDDEYGLFETQDGHNEKIASTPSPKPNASKKCIIPKIHEAKHKSGSLSEVDLMTSNLSVRFNYVRLLWKKRKSKPLIQPGISSDKAIVFPDTWMRQGPLHQNFNRVVSLEIMEADISQLGPSRQEIRNVAKAAFGAKTRRVRVFFYNHYADAIMQLIEKAEKSTKCATMKSREAVRDKIMIALRNIPARCILPFHRHASRFGINEKLLENDYGRLASHCICIGGASNINVQSNEQSTKRTKLRFDSEDLEVGVLVIGDVVNEFVINQMNVDEIELGVRSEIPQIKAGDMLKLYEALNVRENTPVGAAGAALPHANLLFATTIAGQKRKTPSSHHKYTPLSDVNAIYIQNVGKERKRREISLYAAVLNFSPPRRTKRNLMMNIMLFDDSLSLSKDQQCDNGKISISQMKLMIFADEIHDFPQIGLAGEILHGHRILVDEYNGEIYLTAFPWSKLSVCRPKNESRFKDITSACPTTIGDNWMCDANIKNSLDFKRMDELWRFARKRMSSHPNVDPRYSFANADIRKNADSNQKQTGDIRGISGGDCTTMICAIIPFPDDKQTLSSPKGLLRVWDGTGAPLSDSLPDHFPVISASTSQEEPSEAVLLSISNIVKCMKARQVEYEIPLDEESESNNVSVPKCLCGKVVNVVIWEAAHWNLIQSLKASGGLDVGSFIRLKNVIAKNETGASVSTLNVNVNTSLTPIPNSSYEVKTIIIRHHKRVLENHPFNIRSACLPLKILPDWVIGPQRSEMMCSREIRTLLDCILAPPPHSFRVRFCITGMKPHLMGQSLEEVCIVDRKFYKFQFVLHICDLNSNLAVVVPNAVAEEFFGISACQARREIEGTTISMHQKSACDWIKSLIILQRTVEGTINSMFVGGSKFFVLSDKPVMVDNQGI